MAIKAGPSGGSKLTVGFGIVAVPIRYKPLAETTKPISGKMLCPEHGDTLNQQYVCSKGKPEEHMINRDVIVKGYPHPDDPSQLVVVDQSVLDEFAESRTGQAMITRQVDVDEIDPAYYDKTYLVWPEAGAEQAFDLLATALREGGKAAVVTTVMSKQTRMVVFRWSETLGSLLAHVCQFASQLRRGDLELVTRSAAERPAPGKEQVELASTLLASLEGDFDPTDVEDTYTPMVQSAIRQAAGGKKVTAKSEQKTATTGAPDLMEALRASVAAAKEAKSEDKPKPRARKKAAT